MEALHEVQVAHNLLIDIDELTAFVKEGKLFGYAAGSKPIYDEVTKIKRLIYRHGPWLYVDEYRGSFMAPGTETAYYAIRQVFWNDEATLEENLRNYLAVWQMNYSGGMLPQFWQEEKIASLTYDVLKPALQNPDEALPVRGPGEIILQDRLGDLGRYSCITIIGSSMLLFSGYETITLENRYLNKLIIDWPKEGATKTFFQYFNGSIIVYNHQKV